MDNIWQRLFKLQKDVEEIVAEITDIMAVLEEAEEQVEAEPVEDEKMKMFLEFEQFMMNKNKVSKKPRPNKVEETGEDPFAGIGEDALPEGADKIDDNVPRSPRRPPYEPVTVNCSDCGKSKRVHPTFARENYCCDSCLSRKLPR
jgi:regulator of replication initiation timing